MMFLYNSNLHYWFLFMSGTVHPPHVGWIWRGPGVCGDALLCSDWQLQSNLFPPSPNEIWTWAISSINFYRQLTDSMNSVRRKKYFITILSSGHPEMPKCLLEITPIWLLCITIKCNRARHVVFSCGPTYLERHYWHPVHYHCDRMIRPVSEFHWYLMIIWPWLLKVSYSGICWILVSSLGHVCARSFKQNWNEIYLIYVPEKKTKFPLER